MVHLKNDDNLLKAVCPAAFNFKYICHLPHFNLLNSVETRVLSLCFPQLPVPLVLPVNTDGSEATVKSTKESLHPENLQGELNIRPETEIEQSEEGQKHGKMIKEEEGPKPSSLQGKNCF